MICAREGIAAYYAAAGCLLLLRRHMLTLHAERHADAMPSYAADADIIYAS